MEWQWLPQQENNIPRRTCEIHVNANYLTTNGYLNGAIPKKRVDERCERDIGNAQWRKGQWSIEKWTSVEQNKFQQFFTGHLIMKLWSQEWNLFPKIGKLSWQMSFFTINGAERIWDDEASTMIILKNLIIFSFISFISLFWLFT